jgi:sugar diacid utilization regulator
MDGAVLHLRDLLRLEPFHAALLPQECALDGIADVELVRSRKPATLRLLDERGGLLATVVEARAAPRGASGTAAAGPLIGLAEGVVMLDAYAATIQELLVRCRTLASRSGGLLQTLAEADFAGQDLQSIVALLSSLVGNSVMLKDSNYQVVAWHGDLADLDEPRQHTVQAGSIPEPVLAMMDREGVLSRIRNERRPFRIEGHESLGLVPRVVCPVRSGDVYFGYLSISEGRRRLDEQDLSAAEYGATVIAFHVARDRAVQESVRSQKALLVYELLFNPAKRSSTGRRQAAILQLDLDQRFAVIAMEVRSPTNERWDAERWSKARTSMVVTVDGLLARMGISSAVALPEQDHLMVIAPCEADEACRLAAELMRELLAYHQVSVPSVGVSQTRLGSEGLKDSYEEARLAADLGRTLPGATVTPYASLGALRLLNEIPRSALERHLSATLGEDAKFREQFRTTYGALVECGYNKAAAARALYIHVNTLKYRLARIQGITGHDTAHNNGRFALECTLRLLDLQRVRAYSEA